VKHILKTLQKHLAHASARHGTCAPGEFRQIDANELMEALDCRALVSQPADQLTAKKQTSREAAILVMALHAIDGMEYAKIAEALSRVIARLEEVASRPRDEDHDEALAS
jgi:hypothetical protein